MAAAHFSQLKIADSGASIMSVSPHKAVIQAAEQEREADSPHFYLFLSHVCKAYIRYPMALRYLMQLF